MALPLAALWGGLKIGSAALGGLSAFLGGNSKANAALAIQRDQQMRKWYGENTARLNEDAAVEISLQEAKKGYSKRLGDAQRWLLTQHGLNFKQQAQIYQKFVAKHGTGAVGVATGIGEVATTAGRAMKAAELLGRMAAVDAAKAKAGEAVATFLKGAEAEYVSKRRWNNKPLPTIATGPSPKSPSFWSRAAKGLTFAAGVTESFGALEGLGEQFSDFRNALRIRKNTSSPFSFAEGADMNLDIGSDMSKYYFNQSGDYWG